MAERRRYKPLGIVVNPKLRVPVMVVRWSTKKPALDDSVHIYRPVFHEQDWVRAGDGYLRRGRLHRGGDGLPAGARR